MCSIVLCVNPCPWSSSKIVSQSFPLRLKAKQSFNIYSGICLDQLTFEEDLDLLTTPARSQIELAAGT